MSDTAADRIKNAPRGWAVKNRDQVIDPDLIYLEKEAAQRYADDFFGCSVVQVALVEVEGKG